MKNNYIKTKLPVEFAMLHELTKKGQIDFDLRRSLSRKVRSIREELTDPVDKLQHKLKAFGNSGQWGIKQIRELERQIFNGKSVPHTNVGNWVSVEIECIFESQRQLDTFVKFCRAKGLTKFVTVKNDGSIHTDENFESCGSCEGCENEETCHDYNDNALGKEIIVSFELDKPMILELVCAELRRLDCTVNKSCGLHVHYDCRHLTARQVTTIAQRVAKCVPALKQMLPKSRQDNSFCRDVVNGHRTGNRYAFVNVKSYAKHSTLEIRGHSGTIDAAKMLNWIKIVKVIMDKRNKTVYNDIVLLTNAFNFSENLKTYMLSRATKFVKEIRGDDVEQDSETIEPVLPVIPEATLNDNNQIVIPNGQIINTAA